jgi:hypothetical protein
MCEPAVINGGQIGRLAFAGTHLSVLEHQLRTVRNFVQLRDLAPEVPWTPVVQGYTCAEYLRCVDLYERAGVDLTTAPLVGLGSVCRRQATSEAHGIILALHDRGVRRLHGFGVKTLGLLRYGHLLTSADSLAWSYDARAAARPLCGTRHPRGAKNCANCLPYAQDWRTRLLARLAGAAPQLTLGENAA